MPLPKMAVGIKIILLSKYLKKYEYLKANPGRLTEPESRQLASHVDLAVSRQWALHVDQAVSRQWASHVDLAVSRQSALHGDSLVSRQLASLVDSTQQRCHSSRLSDVPAGV